MLALLLAAALAGPPAPPDHQAQHAKIARGADGTAADLTWLSLGAAADLYTTAWALHACPSCYESNALGFDSEARVALKVASTITAAGACYAVRRRGHHRGRAAHAHHAARQARQLRVRCKHELCRALPRLLGKLRRYLRIAKLSWFVA